MKFVAYLFCIRHSPQVAVVPGHRSSAAYTGHSHTATAVLAPPVIITTYYAMREISRSTQDALGTS